jgi:simple sugar transport system ATP-binding protein
MLADFGLDVSPHTEIRHLALGQRQRVEIIKFLFRGTRVLLLDEPTSVLTPRRGDVAARSPTPLA